MKKIFSEKSTLKDLIKKSVEDSGLWEYESVEDFLYQEEEEIQSIIQWTLEEFESVCERRLESILEERGETEESEALTLEERNR